MFLSYRLYIHLILSNHCNYGEGIINYVSMIRKQRLHLTAWKLLWNILYLGTEILYKIFQCRFTRSTKLIWVWLNEARFPYFVFLDQRRRLMWNLLWPLDQMASHQTQPPLFRSTCEPTVTSCQLHSTNWLKSKPSASPLQVWGRRLLGARRLIDKIRYLH